MPVFWKHGFADTSLQELERATGVNKSGLYSEFRDKEDLFVACLRHYLESQEKTGFLTREPLGWKNVETFLKNGPLNKGEQQGCFSVNSMREFAILPDEAYGVVTENQSSTSACFSKNTDACTTPDSTERGEMKIGRLGSTSSCRVCAIRQIKRRERPAVSTNSFGPTRKRSNSLARGAASALLIYRYVQANPLFPIRSAALEMKVSFPTASAAVMPMAEAGILQEASGKRRGRLFVYGKYLDVLNRES